VEREREISELLSKEFTVEELTVRFCILLQLISAFLIIVPCMYFIFKVEYLFGLDTYVSVIMKFDRKSENGKGKMH
jgi:hypothetical protein